MMNYLCVIFISNILCQLYYCTISINRMEMIWQFHSLFIKSIKLNNLLQTFCHNSVMTHENLIWQIMSISVTQLQLYYV